MTCAWASFNQMTSILISRFYYIRRWNMEHNSLNQNRELHIFFNVLMASARRTSSVSICWSFSAFAVRTSAGTLVSYPSISIDFLSLSRLEDSSVRFFSSFSCSLAGSIRPVQWKWHTLTIFNQIVSWKIKILKIQVWSMYRLGLAGSICNLTNLYYDKRFCLATYSLKLCLYHHQLIS